MTEGQWLQFVDTINVLVFAAFVVLLLIGTTSTIIRAVRYQIAREPIPLILIRDLISRTGITVPIAMVFAARALNIGGLQDNLAWIAVTALPALIGVGTYAYFEVFILDGPDFDFGESSAAAEIRETHRMVSDLVRKIGRTSTRPARRTTTSTRRARDGSASAPDPGPVAPKKGGSHGP